MLLKKSQACFSVLNVKSHNEKKYFKFVLLSGKKFYLSNQQIDLSHRKNICVLK